MFKHHPLDSLLVLISCLQCLLLLLPFFVELSLFPLAMLVVLNVFLIGTNYQCIAHNFIHNPFFKSSGLNKAFSLLNTLCLGIPASVYRIHHLEHHRHNNRPDRDETSTYRHGRKGKEENIFLYSTLGVFRTDLLALYKTASKTSALVHVELALLMIFLAGLCLLDWKLLVGYVASSYLLGQVFALWENYCEHHHADFNDRKRDSVSCYHPLYNWVWFNNGYHQEHHFAPQVHWTKISAIKDKLPSDRMIVNYCHLTNSFSSKPENT